MSTNEKLTGEFRTSREAEHMLQELYKASRYCTGENSARRMGERIREVQQQAEILKERGR